MNKFLESNQYAILKKKYEEEYFKLGGDYAWYDGDKIVKKTASVIKEYFKNKKITITDIVYDEEGNERSIKEQKHFIKFGLRILI
jgi:hypothetical protein